MTDEQEEMVAIPKEVFDLALTKANLELIQKVDTLLNLLMEPASNLPKCFADWQDNHATDRGCGNCNLRAKCQASQPNLEKIADDLQALCDEQALRIGRLEALLAQPEKNFVTIVDGSFNHRCPETPLHIKEALAQPEQEPASCEACAQKNALMEMSLATIQAFQEPKQESAIKTLEFLGYTYHEGEQWKPPLGKPPAWLEQSNQRSVSEHLKELRSDEPVAWMKEGWGPDCGPYIEFYRDDEMGWRDRKEWTPLYTTPQQRKEPEQEQRAIGWRKRQISEAKEPKMKPVSAQCKFDSEISWSECSIEHHNWVQSEPDKWPSYKTRLLYAKDFTC